MLDGLFEDLIADGADAHVGGFCKFQQLLVKGVVDADDDLLVALGLELQFDCFGHDGVR